MKSRWLQAGSYVSVAVTVLTLVVAAGGAAHAEPDPQPPDPRDVAMAAMPEFDAIVQGYLAADPGVSEGEARRRAAGQTRRAELVESLSRAYPDTYGGTWYDFATDTQHLLATTPTAAAGFEAAASASQVPVQVRLVDKSLNQLSAEFSEQRAAVGAAVRMDVPGNAVVLHHPPAGQPVESQPTACLDRFNCGGPLRSGINLRVGGMPNDINLCSLAATATGSDGSRWAVTAGHCAWNLGVHASCAVEWHCWRHGEQDIGPMRQTACPAGFDQRCQHVREFVDVGRIRVDSAYWKSFGRGFMFNGAAPESPVDVDATITTVPQLINMVGQGVCMSSVWSTPGDTNCGPLVSAASGSFAFAEVGSMRVCSGDSGGLVYRPAGSRTALGIISLTTDPAPGEPGCHQNTGSTWFAPLPDIYAFWDDSSAARIRLDTR